MEPPIPSLSLTHPKSAAERFLTEMLSMSKWDHLFRLIGIEYPIMPRDFYFIPDETIVTNGRQLEGDDTLVIFFTRYTERKFSTIVVGMRKTKKDHVDIWHPNSISVDLYIRSERLRSSWGAERCTIPVKQVVPQAK